MAGTIEGMTICLMIIVVQICLAIKTGDTTFLVVAAVGVVALGGHVAIVIRDRNKPGGESTESQEGE